MGEEKTALKPMGRPRKAPEKGRRQNYTFRMSDKTRDLLLEQAEKSGRSMSEEIEHRIEMSFDTPNTAEAAALAAAQAVNEASGLVAALDRASLETIFSTLEEFENMAGGRDACSFAVHVGQSLALQVTRDANTTSDDGPWFEDVKRRDEIRAKVLKSVAGLIDNWDFVQKSSMIPSVGWIIDRKIKEKISSGEYDRRAAAVLNHSQSEA